MTRFLHGPSMLVSRGQLSTIGPYRMVVGTRLLPTFVYLFQHKLFRLPWPIIIAINIKITLMIVIISVCMVTGCRELWSFIIITVHRDLAYGSWNFGTLVDRGIHTQQEIFGLTSCYNPSTIGFSMFKFKLFIMVNSLWGSRNFPLS